LVKNSNSHLFCEDNQIRGIKRTFESKERNEVLLPDSKRQTVDDITGRECYNYREEMSTDHNTTVVIQQKTY
jgi:hypothetical protein